jgi:hypothetical protein
MTYANEFHYCYHMAKPKPIKQAHQSDYCLSENYIRCPIFLSGKRMYPQEQKRINTEILTNPTSIHRGRKLSLLQYIAIFTILVILMFTTWMVFARSGIFLQADINPQSSLVLAMDNNATITPTEFLFTPNPTLINELTLQAIKTSLSSRTATITTTLLNNQTPTRTPGGTQQPTVLVCVKPDGWIVYKVKFWDTLAWLSLWTRTSVEELMEANCMTSRKLDVGQEIFLPNFPSITNSTPSPSPTRTYAIPGTTLTFTLTSTSTKTSTITPSSTATKNPLFFDTRTPTRTFTITLTLPPTLTLVPSPTYTKTPTLTSTTTKTPTPLVIPSRTFTSTPTPTNTPTNTPTPTPTNTPTNTPTHTPVPPTNTPTDLPTHTPTNTPTPTMVPTSTPTKTLVLPPTIEPTRLPTGISSN